MAAIALSFITVPFLSAQSGRDHQNDASGTDRPDQSSSQSAPSAADINVDLPSDFRAEERVDEIVGRGLYSAERKKLGEVSDFVIDASTGRIVFAIVSSGGVIGIGEDERLVPASALSRTRVEDDKAFAISLNQTSWESAPTIRRDELATLDDARRNALFDYYHASSDYLRDDIGRNRQPVMNNRQAGQPATAEDVSIPPTQLVRVNALDGKNLLNADQDVGQIEDVLVNFDRRSASILLDPNDELVANSNRVVIAFNDLDLTNLRREGNAITTTLVPDDLRNARHREASASSWFESAANNAPYLWSDGRGEIQGYAAFAPEPIGMPTAAVRTPREDVSADTVRDALEKDPALNDAMSEIKLERSGDQLVLVGEVETQEMKDRINRAAQIHARGWIVQNRLTVKSRPTQS